MKPFQIVCLIFSLILFRCHKEVKKEEENKLKQYITILGVAQDAGYPQINCEKKCCKMFYAGEEGEKLVSSLGLIDLIENKKYIFDATPDIVKQTQILKEEHVDNNNIINGVFLTHAHIGHYTGLMHLGREAMGAKQVPVYAMPKMKQFLEQNAPWSQLVNLNNIELRKLVNDSTIFLDKKLKVTPFLVPHRDEFSETVGYKIEGESKSALFIPDINKWQLWDKSIIEEVKKVDYAFLDATFFKGGEIPRPIEEVPHPFIIETVKLFEKESREIKEKVIFIHFNHTNPALLNSHHLKDSIQNLGYKFAKQGNVFPL
jgi:pyrroloquinoline quinone biosynthesis protein B